MATLESIYASAASRISTIDSQLTTLSSLVLDLQESQDEIETRILDVSFAVMENLISTKMVSLSAAKYDANAALKNSSLYTYLYTKEVEALYGDTDSEDGNLEDWLIKETRILINLPNTETETTAYEYSQAAANLGIPSSLGLNGTDISDANDQFKYGVKYLNQNPTNLDGTYGINQNISNYNSAISILTYDKQQLQDTIDILPTII